MKRPPNYLRALCALAILHCLTHTSRAELLAYWPMDETSGDIATESVNHRNAIWQNPGTNLNWLPAGGMIGGAADLGGQNSGDNFFSLDLNGLLTDADGLTIALWVFPNGFTGDNYEGLFMTRSGNGPGLDGTAAGNGNWGLAWQNGTGGDGQPSTGHLDTRTSGAGRSAANTIQPNSWYHVALVWDGVAETHVQYINGAASEATGVAVGPAGTISGGVWHIGNDSCCANRDFDGLIDDVAVWDEALTATDIADLFAKTKSPANINPPPDNDGDGLPNVYEEMFPDFLDPEVIDNLDDVDRVGGDIAGALMPDGLNNEEERLAGTDPTNPDTDGDGLLDGAELTPPVTDPPTPVTDPLDPDKDGDNILDGEEVTEGTDGFITDPNHADTDRDTFNDDVEIANNTDPTDPLDPPIPALPSDGLVALYRFDEADGDIAFDSAIDDGAQDAATTLGDVAWTAGLIGGAVQFDGNDIMKAGDAIGAGASAFSVSGWVNVNPQSGYRGIFISRTENWGLATENGPNEQRFDLRIDNAGGGSNGLDTANGSATAGAWHHLAITWTTDGTTSLAKAYLDGVEYQTYDSGSGAAVAFGTETVEWFIGSDSNRRLSGLIDDVSVWRVALSTDDIASIYRNGQLGIGVSLPAEVDFRITAIEPQANGDVKLTWNSDPAAGTSYAVLYNRDLSTPSGSWADADDGVPTAGTSTSFTIPADVLKPAPTVEEPNPAPYPDMFFKIRLTE